MRQTSYFRAGELCRSEVDALGASLELPRAAARLRKNRRVELPVIVGSPIGRRLVGILTAADLLAATRYSAFESLRVEDIMTTDVNGLHADADRDALLAWFDRHKLSRAPISDKRGVFLGEVRFSDVVERVLRELRHPLPAAHAMVVDLSDGLPNYTD